MDSPEGRRPSAHQAAERAKSLLVCDSPAGVELFINLSAFWYPHSNMSSSLDQLTADAMKLPLRDRVQLAQRLVSTLDDEVEGDTEALWFAEAERRLEELRSGKVQGIPADDIFRNAREALKQ
jgi:putative addiction module component (TIGR02574 family)